VSFEHSSEYPEKASSGTLAFRNLSFFLNVRGIYFRVGSSSSLGHFFYVMRVSFPSLESHFLFPPWLDTFQFSFISLKPTHAWDCSKASAPKDLSSCFVVRHAHFQLYRTSHFRFLLRFLTNSCLSFTTGFWILSLAFLAR
jgi:hypothetical protein